MKTTNHTKQSALLSFTSQLVINRRSKTFTYFWLEDYVAEGRDGNIGNFGVTSKVKSETNSYDFRINPEGLTFLLYQLGLFSTGKTAHSLNRPKHIRNYKLIK
jgi:hypothetical protein